jgi:membrane fusion protein (multidrug efflux system)
MSKLERIDPLSDESEPLASLPDNDETIDVAAGDEPTALRTDRDETSPAGKAPDVEPAQQTATSNVDTEQASRRPRSRRIRRILFALLPVALVAGGYVYVTGGQIVSTDNAYIEADKTGISTDVSGIVQSVDVTENEHVKTGQVLYRLNPHQFQIALDIAKADLKQTRLTIDAMKQDYRRMLSDISEQQAQVDFDQRAFDRYATLLESNSISRADYDQAQFKLRSAKSKLVSLSQQAEVQLAKLGGQPDIPVNLHPQYLQARAKVDEAQRELSHTIVRAPFAGIVTSVPSIAPGKYMQASSTAFYLVATDRMWVDANPKETQLTYVLPGQPVTVTVDTYPGFTWHGTVDSIDPAAASEFSLLPAQNSSGNWVKVVQRIPMRVSINTDDKNLPTLRAGMSVEVNVDTGHVRGLPKFLATLFGRDNENG